MDDYEELLAEQEEEQLAEALAEEHQAELEVQLEQDEQPPQIDEPPETKRLKRDLQREALARLENAARTTADFHLTVTVSAGSVITKSVGAAWIFRLITVLRLTVRLFLTMSMMY